jgi:hypothetical protein
MSPDPRMRPTVRRGAAFLIVGLYALLGTGACTRHRPPATEVSAEVTQPPLAISREAYLGAIDSSLARIRGKAKRVWIEGAGSVWLTPLELRARRAKPGTGFRTCPPEPTLRLDVPVTRSANRVDLRVTEGGPGGSLPRMYEFVCAGDQCQLRDDYPTNELVVATCGPGVEFGRQPPRHPLTQSVQ